VVAREHGGGASQEARGRRHVTAADCPRAGRTQPFRCPDPQVHAVLVERPELGSVAIRLLEVIAEDLLELRCAPPFGIDDVCPGHELLVQQRPGPLQQPLVGRVADQQVMEAVDRVLIGLIVEGPDQLLSGELYEVILDLGTEVIRRQRLNGLLREAEPDHGRRLDDRALLIRERVEPGCEERMDRRWDREVGQITGGRPTVRALSKPAAFDEHGEQLLDEERVAF
jgi:hypothetical protein